MTRGTGPILPKAFRVPAEWEPQQAVSIATPPPNENFDPSQFAGRTTTTIESVHDAMVRGLSGRTKVRLLANTVDEGRTYAKAIGADQLPPEAFEIAQIAHGDIWVRDTGPIWALNDNGDLAAVWMGFDKWGYLPRITGVWAHSDVPNYLPRDLASALDVPVYRTPLVGEGGGKSFNGKGSLICCRAVETGRNPSLEFPEIEQLLQLSFNVKHIIWVDQGPAEDDQTFDVHPEYEGGTLPGRVFTPTGTGGHVDEFCRFVGPHTILLAQVHESHRSRMSPIEAITNQRMERNLRILEQQRDQDGHPLEILRIPLPPEMIYTIDHRDPVWWTMRGLQGVTIEGAIRVTLAASYSNFLVSNDVVLFPRYYEAGMSDLVDQIDQEAQAVIRRAFPDHEIVLIDPHPVNAGGGGMHCISNDQP